MAVTVVGHWEQSWQVPLTEAPLWELPLRDFGVFDWRMWPVTGVVANERFLREYPSLPECLRDAPGEVILVEPRNPAFPATLAAQDLHQFEHPRDATYVFGSAHFNPVVRLGQGYRQVVIPTQDNRGVLWPHQCAVTVLYDRLVKSWQ